MLCIFIGFAQIHDYSYDVRKQKWCELTLSLSASRKSVDLSNVLKKAAEKAVIYEIKNIKRGIIGKGMFKTSNRLQQEGFSFGNFHETSRRKELKLKNKTPKLKILQKFRENFPKISIGWQKKFEHVFIRSLLDFELFQRFFLFSWQKLD